MKRPANLVILTLIITSITLLLVLEGFWLRSSFTNEYNQLKREVNFVFRTTLFSLQDSVIQKNISPLKRDTGVVRIIRSHNIHDTLRFISKDNPTRQNIPIKRGDVQIFIDAPAKGDSINSLYMRPLITRFKSDTSQKTFTIRLRDDTLRQLDICRNFKIALAESDINLPFEIRMVSLDVPMNPEMQTLATDWVPTFSNKRYMATFTGENFSIVKKLTPQILFSFFLSALTIVSFAFMYRSIRAQQRLVTIKNDLISNITHELKTPIATVSVALEALKNFKGMDNPQLTGEYLDIAQYELGRLSLLTDKVLTASLFDENGVKLGVEAVDLEKIVDEILRSMKLVFEKRKAHVSFDKQGASFMLSGSAVHLTNVVYNLVDNALKYSPSHPEIKIELKDLGESVSFSIADHGIGIPEEYQTKIFDKFFRVPTGDVHTIKGHGLGLNYVHKVVEGHQGKIQVSSKLHEGSTFTFTLPKNTR